MEQDSAADADEAVEQAKAELRAASYKGPDRVVPASELRAELAGISRRSFSFPTGLDNLDAAIGNVESGELIAIGGPTKNGKTLLAQTMTANMAKAGTHCLWFTFEVPAKQFLEQVPESVEFFLPKKLKPGDMEWLGARILEAQVKHDTRVVFIDNLHHLLDFTRMRNVSLDIGSVVRALKRTAVNLNVAILILCHSRKPDGEVQQVSEWDLRDSSFIPQECDSTIMVQRKQRDDGSYGTDAIVKVCLHRRKGTMGQIIHVYRGKDGLLVEDSNYHKVKNHELDLKP